MEETFLTKIEQRLSEANISYQREVPINGLRPDFVVTGPDNQIIVIEAKPWRNEPGFAAMPFDRAYEDAYFVAMAYAAKKNGATCIRTDNKEFTGDIVEEMKVSIRESVAVIVDLSESRPNVLYEAGYAEGVGKPTIHICSTPLEKLPFDVRNWNLIQYTKGQTYQLREPLARRLRSVLRKSSRQQD